LLAAYLGPQIATIRERLPKRQAIANRYREAFADTSIRMQEILPGCSTADHVFPIAVTPAVRDEAIARLNRLDVGVAVNYRSVPTLTYYREKYGFRPDSFPVSYEWGASTLTLPLYPALEKDKQEWVISSVLEDVEPLCRDASETVVDACCGGSRILAVCKRTQPLVKIFSFSEASSRGTPAKFSPSRAPP